MEFERSILYRLKEVYLEGTFNEIHIQCRNGARRIPSFLLYAISPLFRQDPSWTGVILPDVSLQDLDEFMSCTLSYGSQGTQSCETLFHLFESFTLFSSVRDNKRAAKQQRRCSKTSYGLRPFRKKIKFIDEVSEDENEEGDPGYDFENESDYEPAFQEEDEEEAEDEYIQEEEESMENTTSNNAIDDNVSSDEDITTSSSQYDDDEDDLYEERNLLRIESEGEDDDLYEYHLSSHQSDLENLDEEDITLVTVKLNEEGEIQMIDQVNDPENGELVDSVGNLLSEESPEKNTKEGSLNNDFLENVTTHRLLLNKVSSEGSFFRLPLGHPHAKCLSCMELFSSYRALIAGNKDLQLKDICFCCPHCRRRFMGRINALRSHLKEEHYELMEPFESTKLVNLHLLSCSSDYIGVSSGVFCRICGKTFSQLRSLELHCMNMHRAKIIWNRSKMLFCSQCPAARHSKSALRKHFTKHNTESSICLVFMKVVKPVPILLSLFSVRNICQRKLYLSARIYTKCPHCGKLKKGVSLKTHMKRCGLTSVKIKCTDCSMDFKHVEDMQAHSLIHYGQVTCPIHNILFKNESEIYHHVNIAGANNSPRLQCCMCSRLFLYMCNFMQHLRRHLKISPYRCSICRKSVQSYASLRHHVRRMHVEDSSNKNFSCEHCQKEFTTKGHLKEHIAGVHERYNNVHCPVCHKSFNTQKRMKKHLFATHKEMADQFRSHSKVEVFATASFKT
ncbi:KRAB [Lepeophtheirus salmonis]|uniref:KRAB n=1 Tax=Lepeophtheirus salmonis TaxID=72036 RepID=A0A7R8CRD5_LEPSM|nr:KRAB [Lepeophtheirus salmonis]CAF2904175.1 KRAB [Lepeophtheirus salmonis]